MYETLKTSGRLKDMCFKSYHFCNDLCIVHDFEYYYIFMFLEINMLYFRSVQEDALGLEP